MLRGSLVVFGVILLVAAAAKSWMLAADPFADLVTGYPFWLLVLAVLVELLLGVVVFTPIPLSLVWLAYLGFFLILLAVSLVRWAMGFQSCDCFGSIQLPIWVTPVLNVVTITILVWFRPLRRELLDSIRVGAGWLSEYFPQPIKYEDVAGCILGVFGVGLLCSLALPNGILGLSGKPVKQITTRHRDRRISVDWPQNSVKSSRVFLGFLRNYVFFHFFLDGVLLALSYNFELLKPALL